MKCSSMLTFGLRKLLVKALTLSADTTEGELKVSSYVSISSDKGY